MRGKERSCVQAHVLIGRPIRPLPRARSVDSNFAEKGTDGFDDVDERRMYIYIYSLSLPLVGSRLPLFLFASLRC